MWGKRSVWAVPPMSADGWVRPVVPTRRGAVQRELGMPEFDPNRVPHVGYDQARIASIAVSTHTERGGTPDRLAL